MLTISLHWFLTSFFFCFSINFLPPKHLIKFTTYFFFWFIISCSQHILKSLCNSIHIASIIRRYPSVWILLWVFKHFSVYFFFYHSFLILLKILLFLFASFHYFRRDERRFFFLLLFCCCFCNLCHMSYLKRSIIVHILMGTFHMCHDIFVL